MACNLKNLYSELSKLNIRKINNIAVLNLTDNKISLDRERITRPRKFNTYEYETLEFNINRIMFLFEGLCHYEKIRIKKHNINASYKFEVVDLRFQAYCEIILSSLITTIEVFLDELFRRISGKISLTNLDLIKLKKFLKKFGYKYKNKYFKKEKYVRKFVKKYNSKSLKEILKDRLDFQQGENCKVAFSLININLPALDNTLWEKIFSKGNKYSLIELRHRIIHMGANSLLLKRFIIEDIKEAILNSVKFLYLVESERQKKFPYGPDVIEIYDNF